MFMTQTNCKKMRFLKLFFDSDPTILVLASDHISVLVYHNIKVNMRTISIMGISKLKSRLVFLDFNYSANTCMLFHAPQNHVFKY